MAPTTRATTRRGKAERSIDPIPGEFITPKSELAFEDESPLTAHSNPDASTSSEVGAAQANTASRIPSGQLSYAEATRDSTPANRDSVPVNRDSMPATRDSVPATQNSEHLSVVTGDNDNEVHTPHSRRPYVEDVEDEEASRQSSDPAPEDGGFWTKVAYGKRKKSNVILERVQNEVESDPGPVYSTEQRNAIRYAEDSMAAADRAQYARRMNHVAAEESDSGSSLSRGEGPSDPSKRQGKTVDPRNWGGAGLDDEELDPDNQRRALEAYARKKAGGSTAMSSDSELDQDGQRALFEYYASLRREQKKQRKKARRSVKIVPPVQQSDAVASTENERVAMLEREVATLSAALRQQSSAAAGPVSASVSKKHRKDSDKPVTASASKGKASVVGRMGEFGDEANLAGVGRYRQFPKRNAVKGIKVKIKR